MLLVWRTVLYSIQQFLPDLHLQCLGEVLEAALIFIWVNLGCIHVESIQNESMFIEYIPDILLPRAE